MVRGVFIPCFPLKIRESAGSQLWGSARESTRGEIATEDLAPTRSAAEQLGSGRTQKAVGALPARFRPREPAHGSRWNENENFFLMVELWKIPRTEGRTTLASQCLVRLRRYLFIYQGRTQCHS